MVGPMFKLRMPSKSFHPLPSSWGGCPAPRLYQISLLAQQLWSGLTEFPGPFGAASLKGLLPHLWNWVGMSKTTILEWKSLEDKGVELNNYHFVVKGEVPFLINYFFTPFCMGSWYPGTRARGTGYTAKQGSVPCHVKITSILGSKNKVNWDLGHGTCLGSLLSLGQVRPGDRISFLDVDHWSLLPEASRWPQKWEARSDPERMKSRWSLSMQNTHRLAWSLPTCLPAV